MNMRNKRILKYIFLFIVLIVLTYGYYSYFTAGNEKKDKNEQLKELYDIAERITKNNINLLDISKESIRDYMIFSNSGIVTIRFNTKENNSMEIILNNDLEVLEMNPSISFSIELPKLFLAIFLAILTEIVIILLIFKVKQKNDKNS